MIVLIEFKSRNVCRIQEADPSVKSGSENVETSDGNENLKRNVRSGRRRPQYQQRQVQNVTVDVNLVLKFKCSSVGF